MEASLLEDFYKQFNSRLNSYDFVLSVGNLKDNYDPWALTYLTLPVETAEIYTYLLDSDYVVLLTNVIRSIRIEPSCVDIFRSELDDETLSFYVAYLKDQTAKAIIHSSGTSNDFRIYTGTLMCDLIWSAISQMHSEMVETFKQFLKYIEVVHGNTSNLFLRPNASTPFSTFIQIWTSKSLNIPTSPNHNILVI